MGNGEVSNSISPETTNEDSSSYRVTIGAGCSSRVDHIDKRGNESVDENLRELSSQSESFESRSSPIKLSSPGKYVIKNGIITIRPEQSATIPEDILSNSSLKDYWDIGDPDLICNKCRAIVWFGERSAKDQTRSNATISMCCGDGDVGLPRLGSPPPLLADLMSRKSRRSRHFMERIRAYNMMFAFTSLGGRIKNHSGSGAGPRMFTVSGQNTHRIGSLLPEEGGRARFQQMYIYDTDNELANRKSAVSSGRANDFDDEIVEEIIKMLDEHNPYVKQYRMARDRLQEEPNEQFLLRLIGKRAKDGRTYNLPSASEVAALIIGDGGSVKGDRDIVVEQRSGVLDHISELHPGYLPLQYPLLFPYGEDGYRLEIPHNGEGRSKKRNKVTMREWFAYRLMDRLNEPDTLLRAGKLFQQFVVDGWTMVESERLKYIRFNQKKLRADSYSSLRDSVARGDANNSSSGRLIVLPSTFQGSARFMNELYHDAMGLCRAYGFPDLFITFTCNPKWPEIVRFAKAHGVRAEDRPDILSRVFKMNLDALINDCREQKVFGKVNAVVYTVEFQKRGLPHAHIVLFLHRDDKIVNPCDIDSIISAEIPDKDKQHDLYGAVTDYMVHGPCGAANPGSPCMDGGRCTKRFPKRFTTSTTVDDVGYPVYMRRDTGATVNKNGIILDNRSVVPYNAKLLLKYRAHINVEWCNQSRAVKYLFKYINKGSDRVTAGLVRENDDSGVVDEIKEYYDCRYVSACEASWRILRFEIHFRVPAVQRLSFHLPDEQSVVFREDDNVESVLSRPSVERSMFLSWMECNAKYEEARSLLYAEFPGKFRWHIDSKKWAPRKQGYSVGRLYHVPVGSGERYYLRTLLNYVGGPKCFEDIRTVNGVIYPTFRDACYARGLLDDDKEYVDGILEASLWASGHYLRKLFAMLIMSNSISIPEFVWEHTWKALSEDVLISQRKILGMPDLQLTEKQQQTYALVEIDKILQSNGMSLRSCCPELYPDEVTVSDGRNKLILEEAQYDRDALQAEHESLMKQMTDEQRRIYDEIMGAVSSGKGGVYFLYGHGGTGKTYMWRTLCAALRSRGEIVLPVASSGIASLLLPNGRIAHSRFGIPININSESVCSRIHPNSELTTLLIKTSLIIWDEAPMMHRHCFEALDRSMRDAIRGPDGTPSEQPFGGKVVVFGGDLRQILPVVPKGTRQDIVFATLNSSYLWQKCKVLKLTKNMRLLTGGSEADEIREFADWILDVGDGNVGGPNDGEVTIDIPDDLLIKDAPDPLRAIVDSTYSNLEQNVHDNSFFHDRAILAPTNDVVSKVNDFVLSMLDGEEKVYLSSDCVSKSDCGSSDSINFSVEFLNTIKCSGLPNHEIRLKVGAPVMLMRNIDPSAGLCNGTRLIVNHLGERVIQATILSGCNKGERVLIPRINLSPSDSAHLPVRLQRRQFPLALCFAMTINKSQGQSLSRVGLFLPVPVFSHGPLYVALSRVTSRKGLKILICDDHDEPLSTTENVVYKEVFQNL